MRVCNDRLYELVDTYLVEDAFWHGLVERLSVLQGPRQGPFCVGIPSPLACKLIG